MLSVNGREITAMIFDIDGTLVDSFPVLYSVFNRGIGHYELGPVSLEFLMGCFKQGQNLDEILRRVFPPHSEASLIEKCRKEISDLFWEIELDEVKLFTGATDLFKYLKERGIRIGIATGRTSLPEKEWDRFGRFGVHLFIDAIVTTREVGKRKPAPDAILECAQRLRVSIKNCLVVGDTVDDILAARSAGALAVAVSTGQDERDLLEKENPELLFDSLKDLSFFLNEQERKEKKKKPQSLLRR